MSSRTKFLIGLVAYTFAVRLLPYFALKGYDHTTNPFAYFYPWNFVPLMALCLYSGATVSNRLASIAPPLIALVASDLGIWAITGQFSHAFPPDYWTVYVCYLAAVFMGTGLNRGKWPGRAINALFRGILAEALFFLVTNFAYFISSTNPPYTLAGLFACYVAAIPFAGKSFLSTAFYSVLFFSPLAEAAAGEQVQTQEEFTSAKIQ